MTEPIFLTTKEVAELLRVKERKVYDLVAANEIPHRRITGKILFPKDAIARWLATGAEGATLPAIVAGSHDPLLDWAIRQSGCGLASAFDGSISGLHKLRQGEAQAAAIHVPEPGLTEWNHSIVLEELGSGSYALIEWGRRQQGIILSAQLKDRISALDQLKGRRMAKRQPAAGAARLFSLILAQQNLSEADFEVAFELARTETEAAAAVASGDADFAPGLQAVANQFGLGFLPTCQERYDLLIDRHAFFEPPMQSLMNFARSQVHATKARDLGGYDISGFGTVHWNG